MDENHLQDLSCIWPHESHQRLANERLDGIGKGWGAIKFEAAGTLMLGCESALGDQNGCFSAGE